MALMGLAEVVTMSIMGSSDSSKLLGRDEENYANPPVAASRKVEVSLPAFELIERRASRIATG